MASSGTELETNNNRVAAVTRIVGAALMINGLFRPYLGVLLNGETSNNISPLVPIVGLLLVALSLRIKSKEEQLGEESRMGIAVGLATAFSPSLDIFPSLFALGTAVYGAATVGRVSLRKFIHKQYETPQINTQNPTLRQGF